MQKCSKCKNVQNSKKVQHAKKYNMQKIKLEEAYSMFGVAPFRKNEPQYQTSGDLGKMIESFFDDNTLWGGWGLREHSFRVDVKDDKESYLMEAELPGIKKENIKLHTDGDTLTIGVQYDENVESDEKRYIKKERRIGRLSRTFRFQNIQENEITAKYEDGILMIRIPKDIVKLSDSRNIEIQ